MWPIWKTEMGKQPFPCLSRHLEPEHATAAAKPVSVSRLWLAPCNPKVTVSEATERPPLWPKLLRHALHLKWCYGLATQMSVTLTTSGRGQHVAWSFLSDRV